MVFGDGGNIKIILNPTLPGKRLLPTAPHPNQEGIPPLLLYHAHQAAHMLYGIHEEHQVHLFRGAHVEVI